MPEKKYKQVCECEKCGNEAEMLITCHLEDNDESSFPENKNEEKKKVKGVGVCSHCGNESDMWIDM